MIFTFTAVVIGGEPPVAANIMGISTGFVNYPVFAPCALRIAAGATVRHFNP